MDMGHRTESEPGEDISSMPLPPLPKWEMVLC